MLTDIKEFRFPKSSNKGPVLYRNYVIGSEDDLYILLRLYVMVQSSAKDYISNYMDIMLKHISKRIFEDGYTINDFIGSYYH